MAKHPGGALDIRTTEGALAAANAIRNRVHERQVALAQRGPGLQPVVQHIVERQVVVMRCRYCAQLTPAEMTRCQNCGAMMGGA